MAEDSTGNAARLPLAERARTGALLAEPELSLSELLFLEHPTDTTARTALGAALGAAIRFGELAVRRETRPARREWRPARFVLRTVYGEPRDRGQWVTYRAVTTAFVEREDYRRWRAQCPARLLSDLSQIGKWLGEAPVHVESQLEPSLPEPSRPVETLPVASSRPIQLRPDQQDKRDCQEIARALWAEHPEWRQVEVLAHPKIAPYRKQWPGKGTVPGWLSEVDPRPKNQRRGRPARR